MRFDTLARLDRDARRVGEIAGVLARYGLADWLKGIHVGWLQDRLRSDDGQPIGDLPFERRVRLALTELGTTFIKLGQILSTRADLTGPELAAELAHLQADTPADPPEEVSALIREELGYPPEMLFATFEPEAMASASIAQVHRARLKTGEEVVVKVQKHGITERIQSDLEILAALAELAERHSDQLRPYQPAATVRQFRKTLLRELDFTFERRHLEEFRGRFADDPGVRFPAVHERFSSRKVLTMERLEGIGGGERERLARSGVDLDEFSRRGATLFLEMIFRDSFYHADPHPGNLMLLPGGVIGVIDCGMVGRIDEELREEVETLLLCMVERDGQHLTETVLRIGAAPADCPRERLRADLDEFLADFVGQPLDELDLSEALNQLTGIIRRYRITLPPALSLLLRTLVVLEGTSRQLNPGFSLAEAIRPFYASSMRRRLAPGRLLGRMRRTWRDWDRLVEALPRDVTDLLARIRNGTFNVHLDHRHLDPVVNRLVLGIITAALFVSSSLLWSMKAPPMVGGVSVVGAAGYLAATYLGWRLYRAIKASGNVDSSD